MTRDGPPIEDYLQLTVSEVMVDLPGLDVEQLALVLSLERAGPRRAEILERITELLDQQDQPDPTDIRPTRRPPRLGRLVRATVAVILVGAMVKGAAVRLGRELAPASAGAATPVLTHRAHPTASRSVAATKPPVSHPPVTQPPAGQPPGTRPPVTPAAQS